MVNATNHNLWSSRPEILTYSGPVPIPPGFLYVCEVFLPFSTLFDASYKSQSVPVPMVWPFDLNLWPRPLASVWWLSWKSRHHGLATGETHLRTRGVTQALYGPIMGLYWDLWVRLVYVVYIGAIYIYTYMYESTSTKRREGLVELTMRSNLLSDRDWRVTKLSNNKPLIIFYQYTLHPTYIIYPSNSWVTCSFQSWLDMVLP